jgi:SAM-dependent methyltransferase
MPAGLLACGAAVLAAAAAARTAAEPAALDNRRTCNSDATRVTGLAERENNESRRERTMTTADAAAIDQARAEEFAGKVVGALNNAFTGLMISVGHRTGLFDALAGMAPSTSDEIAKATGLNERYVREWLGNMTVAGFVEHDAARGTYTFPAEHAASLTRAAGPGNLAAMTEFIALMGRVEDDVVHAFRNGGGVPYSKFDTFQELMRESSASVFDATLLDVTLRLVDGLTEQLKQGIDVADVGCGAGHAINIMAKAFPQSRFTGYDFSDEGIAIGRAEAKEWGLKNATFEVKDVATLDGSKKFDLITVFDAIHDQAHPRRVLKGIADSLKPGGVFLCADIAGDSSHAGNMDHPLAAMLYAISTFHCMTVSLALGGEGLGTMWGQQKARELFQEAGFTSVEEKNVEGDILNVYYICRKG